MQATHTDPPAAMEIRTAPHEVSSDWADFYPLRAGTSVFQNSVGLAAAIALIQCGDSSLAIANQSSRNCARIWLLLPIPKRHEGAKFRLQSA